MKNKLREIAESKGRELFLVGNYDFKHGLCAAFETERAANEAVDLINRSNDPCIMGVTEKSHADKLAAALKVAVDVIDEMSETLKSVEKNQCYDCACGNKAEDALAAAEKTMGEL